MGGPCARGCKKRGEHFAACESFGGAGGSCRGCVPREAVGESLICGRCFHRTKAMLEGAPDLLAHIRGLTDPLKGTAYDREQIGVGVRVHAPPPVPVELLDAADFIVTLLWSAVTVVRGGEPYGRMVVPVAADPGDVLVYARDAVDEILSGLSGLSEREAIVPLVDATVGAPPSRDEWTLRTIAERWSVADELWWAAQPCPVCGLRAIKVTPPETPADETNYRCASCTWVAPDDVDGFWAEAFSRREGKAA